MVPLVLLGATTGLVREPLLPSAASRSHAAAKQQLPPSGTKLDEFAVLVGRCTPGPRMCASAAFDPPPFPLPEGSRAAVVLFVDSDDSFNGAKKLGAFADRAVDFARRGCAVVAVCSAEGSRPASAARWPSIRFVEDEGGEARRWAGLEGGEIATLVLDLEATPRLAATLRSKADPFSHVLGSLRALSAEGFAPEDRARRGAEARREQIRAEQKRQEAAAEAYRARAERDAARRAEAKASEAAAAASRGYGLSANDQAKSSLEAMFALELDGALDAEAVDAAAAAEEEARVTAAAAAVEAAAATVDVESAGSGEGRAEALARRANALAREAEAEAAAGSAAAERRDAEALQLLKVAYGAAGEAEAGAKAARRAADGAARAKEEAEEAQRAAAGAAKRAVRASRARFGVAVVEAAAEAAREAAEGAAQGVQAARGGWRRAREAAASQQPDGWSFASAAERSVDEAAAAVREAERREAEALLRLAPLDAELAKLVALVRLAEQDAVAESAQALAIAATAALQALVDAEAAADAADAAMAAAATQVREALASNGVPAGQAERLRREWSGASERLAAELAAAREALPRVEPEAAASDASGGPSGRGASEDVAAALRVLGLERMPSSKAEVNDAALRLLRVSHPDVSSAADAVDITRSVLAARACLRARL